MDRRYSLEWLRVTVLTIGIIMIIASVIAAAAVPIIMTHTQEASIGTYYDQALNAVTTGQFSADLHKLNDSLASAGMIRGSTGGIIALPQDEMAYKREQFSLISQRADTFAALPLSSLEVSHGLPDLKNALRGTSTGAYGFWLWQQNGIWIAAFLPLMVFVAGFFLAILYDHIPESVTRRSRIVGSTG